MPRVVLDIPITTSGVNAWLCPVVFQNEVFLYGRYGPADSDFDKIVMLQNNQVML